MDAGPACTVIQVVSTTYAANCGTPTLMNKVDDECDGKADCTYPVDFKIDPGFDPASGCPKDLTVNYLCVDDGGKVLEGKAAYTPAEAYSITLECGCY